MITIYKPKQEENYEVKTKKYKGKNCLVVPVVMMVEGVHAGSKGPLLHTINDLGKFPESWDGIPVVVNHPQNETGQNISANSPEVLEAVGVGKIFNTHVNGTKLMADAYIYPDKLKIVSNNILEAIKETKIIEVSVGVFAEEEPVENGDWNGETYKAIARNHRPDHLALLPGAKGACSIKDGCGLGANQKGVDMDLIKTFAELQDVGKFVSDITNNMTESFDSRLNACRDLVRSLNTQTSYNYLVEAYDDYLIYEYSENGVGVSKLFKQNYQANVKSGNLEFVGDKVEVKRETHYVNVNALNVNEKKKNMERGNNPPCGQCMEKIVAIINDNSTPYTAEHREFLLTQKEEFLDAIMPKKIEVNAGDDMMKKSDCEKTKVVTNTVVKEVVKEVPMVLSAEDQAALNYGKKQLAEKRAAQIEGIQANTSKELWPDEMLTVMSEDTLERLFNSVKKVDYSPMGNNQRTEIKTNARAPMLPTGMDVEEIKK
jgi:hypothetical protein